jgi:hypothetical protein
MPLWLDHLHRRRSPAHPSSSSTATPTSNKGAFNVNVNPPIPGTRTQPLTNNGHMNLGSGADIPMPDRFTAPDNARVVPQQMECCPRR